MHALVASPYKSAYNAAKHGIAGLTKTVGLELAQKGNITCNAICPGWVVTSSPDTMLQPQAWVAGCLLSGYGPLGSQTGLLAAVAGRTLQLSACIG